MNKKRALSWVIVGAAAAMLAGCGGWSADPKAEPDAETAVANRSPSVGSPLPDVEVKTVEDEEVSLRMLAGRQPTVLVIYRGGWCMFCNRHLAELQRLEPELQGMGYQILAVSPDRPAKLRESVEKHQLSYTLVSDSDLRAAKALGLAFHVDDATNELYKTKYKIDLEDASGRMHHDLPVPAIFVVGADGKIHFEHVDPDYKRRLEADKLLEAARQASGQ